MGRRERAHALREALLAARVPPDLSVDGAVRGDRAGSRSLPPSDRGGRGRGGRLRAALAGAGVALAGVAAGVVLGRRR